MLYVYACVCQYGVELWDWARETEDGGEEMGKDAPIPTIPSPTTKIVFLPSGLTFVPSVEAMLAQCLG